MRRFGARGRFLARAPRDLFEECEATEATNEAICYASIYGLADSFVRRVITPIDYARHTRIRAMRLRNYNFFVNTPDFDLLRFNALKSTERVNSGKQRALEGVTYVVSRPSLPLHIMSSLNAAGAICFATTAGFSSEARNPYNPDLTAGSGAAGAIASGIGGFALTDRSPENGTAAALCGVVSFRPDQRLVSVGCGGGFIARTLEDLEAILNVVFQDKLGRGNPFSQLVSTELSRLHNFTPILANMPTLGNPHVFVHPEIRRKYDRCIRELRDFQWPTPNEATIALGAPITAWHAGHETTPPQVRSMLALLSTKHWNDKAKIVMPIGRVYGLPIAMQVILHSLEGTVVDAILSTARMVAICRAITDSKGWFTEMDRPSYNWPDLRHGVRLSSVDKRVFFPFYWYPPA